MSDGQLTAIPEQYAQAAGRNTPPPPILSDPLVAGASPIEALMRVLGLAANAGDSGDYTGSLEGHAARDLHTSAAAEGFTGQDQNAASQMQATTQLIPQLAAGIAGALGGVLQPLAQLPQQLTQGLTQGLTQAVQAGALRQSDSAAAGFDDLSDMDGLDGMGSEAASDGDAFGEPFGTGAIGASGGGKGAGTGRPGATVPAAPLGPLGPLGPPAVPSPSTSPAAASPAITRGAAAPASAPAGTAGMAGTPMMPPGAVMGAPTGERGQATTRRIAAPAIRNGAAVQGRLSVTMPVAADGGGAPVVVRRTP